MPGLAHHTYDLNAHHELARRIAAHSAVLLKNEDRLLPIDPRRTIALIGALAQHPHFQGIGSSDVNPTRVSSLVDGFQERGLSYAYYPGYLPRGRAGPDLVAEAVAGAQVSDVAVIVVGLAEEIESEGLDRADLALPGSHNELVNRVADANPNTVVVLVAGAPVEMPWLPKVKAVLNLHLAGQAGGLAAAELLTGAVNPSGKLAVTYPVRYSDVPSAGFFEQGGRQAEYRESIYVGYRYYDKAGKETLFPFGHGLSYTSFEYRDLVLSKTEMQDTEALTVTATIQNTGDRDGAEIVQLYVGDLEPGILRPERELKGFAKVFLRAGEERQVEFVLGFRSFACYDPAAKAWIVPQGDYQIFNRRVQPRSALAAECARPSGTSYPCSILAGRYTQLSGPVSRADFRDHLWPAHPSDQIPAPGGIHAFLYHAWHAGQPGGPDDDPVPLEADRPEPWPEGLNASPTARMMVEALAEHSHEERVCHEQRTHAPGAWLRGWSIWPTARFSRGSSPCQQALVRGPPGDRLGLAGVHSLLHLVGCRTGAAAPTSWPGSLAGTALFLLLGLELIGGEIPIRGRFPPGFRPSLGLCL